MRRRNAVQNEKDAADYAPCQIHVLFMTRPFAEGNHRGDIPITCRAVDAELQVRLKRFPNTWK